MHYFGADIGLYDDLEKAQKEIIKYGGNMLQIFILPKKNYDINLDVKVVVHSSYLNNMCKEWDKYSWWINNLENEIIKAERLKANIVLHFGKAMDLKIEDAYNNMYSALLYIHMKTIKYNSVRILLETPAGQGTEICSTLDTLAHFYNKIKNSPNRGFRKRIKICVDTCHIFAAGHDISSIKKIDMYLEAFDKGIGIKHIKLIHLNDSKGILGCKVDRHIGLGQGYIGLDNLFYIYSFFKKLNVPIILETPNINYRTEINNFLNK